MPPTTPRTGRRTGTPPRCTPPPAGWPPGWAGGPTPRARSGPRTPRSWRPRPPRTASGWPGSGPPPRRRPDPRPHPPSGASTWPPSGPPWPSGGGRRSPSGWASRRSASTAQRRRAACANRTAAAATSTARVETWRYEAVSSISPRQTNEAAVRLPGYSRDCQRPGCGTRSATGDRATANSSSTSAATHSRASTGVASGSVTPPSVMHEQASDDPPAGLDQPVRVTASLLSDPGVAGDVGFGLLAGTDRDVGGATSREHPRRDHRDEGVAARWQREVEPVSYTHLRA